jgi:ABC-type lipoprotein release transport system permease subunit
MTNRQNVGLAFTMAIKSLLAHRTKSMIVGSLLTLGTILVTCGIALLDNVESSISRSVIESLAGHLQIYDARAKDKLAIYGDGSGGMPDVGEIESFQSLLDAVDGFENVEALIPMGVNLASMNRGNPLERRLANWRKEIRTESKRARVLRIKQTQDLIAEFKSDLNNQLALADETRQIELQGPLDSIALTEADGFWADCLLDPTQALELIDTRIAPFAGDGRVLYLRYVGTDFTRFHKHFARFKLVSGSLIPPGERGMLINKTFADARLKLLPARLLDKLAESANENVRIEDSADFRSKARRLKTQVKSVTRLIGPESVQSIKDGLSAPLNPCPVTIDALLTCLFTLSSDQVVEHHRLFYAVVAPHIELYPFEVGKTMTLKSFTKSGFPKAANVKVWGTYYFKGLDNSMLSGAANLVDLDTFRELYGVSTTAQRSELAQMKAESGSIDVQREDVEAMLFGGAPTTELKLETTKGARAENQLNTDASPTLPAQDSSPMDLVQNAAVFLSDVSRLDETKAALNSYFKTQGLPYQVIDWKEASGLIGQLAVLTRAILIIALIIIFGVAVIIINNSMVMATLERIREIGTMRAIGAQRNFMLLLVMLESLVISIISGLIGIVLSMGIFLVLGEFGIPATNDIAKFFFSGPRLYPVLEFVHVLYGLVTVILIGLAATYYPARIAIRVKPIEAMSGAE